MRPVGSAVSADRTEAIASGPLVLSSLLDPTARVRGLTNFRPESTSSRQTIQTSPDPAGAKVYSLLAAPKEEICDVNADFVLGLENYSAAIALHRKVLRAHNDNAFAHYHLGFAYGISRRTADEISEYLAAARLGLHKWDLFLNLGLAYLGHHDWPPKTLDFSARSGF